MSTLEENLSENQPKHATISIGLEDARRLREEILRYRRENLRQAQRALEISKLCDAIIEQSLTSEPAGRE